MRRVQFTRYADKQYSDSFVWYERQQPGLGTEFGVQVDTMLLRIARNPEQFRIVAKRYRRALIQRFPFELFFDFDEASITVYAVFHTSQHPAGWASQLK